MNAKPALEPFFSISALRWGLLLSSPVGIQSRLLSKGLAFVSVGFLQRITAIQHPLVFKHGLMVVTVSFLFFFLKAFTFSHKLKQRAEVSSEAASETQHDSGLSVGLQFLCDGGVGFNFVIDFFECKLSYMLPGQNREQRRAAKQR